MQIKKAGGTYDITEYFADNGAEDIPFLGELFFEIDSVEHELTDTLELNVDTTKFKLHKLELPQFHTTAA